MKSITLIFLFSLFLTFSFGQNNANPFELSNFEIKEKKVKKITEYDGDNALVKFGKYDEQGNQIYFKEDNRIIEFELDYDPNGYLTKEIATGLNYEIILKREIVLNQSGKVDSVIYNLPLPMYYEGFSEKYIYNKDGSNKSIIVYELPEKRKLFQYNYTYNSDKKLKTLQTLGFGDEGTQNYFKKEFEYFENGSMKIVSQITENGDTISISSYNIDGELINEKISIYYTTPNGYLYSPILYAEALKDLETPLTTFSIVTNINRKKDDQNYLMNIDHSYKGGNLIKSVQAYINGDKVYKMAEINFTYNYVNELVEKTTINFNKPDTTIVSYKQNQGQKRIDLNQKSRSYVLINKNPRLELSVESFLQQWECKTITTYDSLLNTVTKERYCLEEGIYPNDPEKVTVAKFDSKNRQINEKSYLESRKADQNTSYTFSENGSLVEYQYNGLYWKYYYNSTDSVLTKQAYYSDSIYENMIAFFTYKYDTSGNYEVKLTYSDKENKNPNNPILHQFDAEGKILKQEWESYKGSDKGTMTFIYNEMGLCIEEIFERGSDGFVTQYVYEFY
ncbi:hypothetical protein ERX46_04570 [Brumimicrobium glaciale]|uniref:RHS repeat protein n=1 Tax=Brumimicrobium glaciale TaxID=200475 RepID=A0A4Q4KQ24_9FLAO|nr:hypothetical protein [Brumimicrobium glaciale]RYM34654.1 hypothetical protein ERX46_04570 [Brumimicrobium glaciale]